MRCSRKMTICLGMFATFLFLGSSLAPAQPRDRDRERDEPSALQLGPPQAEPEFDGGREGGIPMRDVAPMRQGGNNDGTLDGAPEMQQQRGNSSTKVAPYVVPGGNWKLGVYAYNTDTGVVITRVTRNSAAQDAGLERGDRIVAVAGFQIGIVDGRLYPLGHELQRRADRRGNVKLLVQNVRNDRLLILDVRLDN